MKIKIELSEDDLTTAVTSWLRNSRGMNATGKLQVRIEQRGDSRDTTTYSIAVFHIDAESFSDPSQR